MTEPKNKQPDYRQLMAQALKKIESLESRVQEKEALLQQQKREQLNYESTGHETTGHETSSHEPIAIIGMGCRFPGSGQDDESGGLNGFLQLLREGKDAIGPIPPWRWDVEQFYHPDPDQDGKSYVKEGGFVESIREMDAGFFEISPREAMGIDPQQRLWLEVCWEALENAGIVPADLYASQTGVFAGGSSFDFAAVMAKSLPRDTIDAYLGTGASLNILAGRVSYLLGLNGPSMAIDTACSSSLVAIHTACQSLRQQECELALAGGVNVLLSPETYIAFSRGRMLSPQARCKTFSEDADGFIRSEGCGAVVLKRLSDAVNQGDRIYAVINGSAVNQDGPCGGLTVPSGPAQQAVIGRALKAAQIPAEKIRYIEAHGTGTPLGDPIEMGALGAIYGQKAVAGQADNRDESPEKYVGAVKTNLGHLEAAAGIAGLIKTVLSLHYGEIYPNLHFSQPSQRIDWQSWPVTIPTQLSAWPSTDITRHAAVSSFGLSGTNAHMIVSSYSAESRTDTAHRSMPEQQLLVLSARNHAALIQMAEQYAKQLDQSHTVLADLCYSHHQHRSRFEQRIALMANTEAEMSQRLKSFAENSSIPAKPADSSESNHTSPMGSDENMAHDSNGKVAFLFTGQGSQWLGMANPWYGELSEFTRCIDQCHEILQKEAAFDLKKYLGIGLSAPLDSADLETQISLTGIAQPVLFAFEYALAKQWIAWGVEPDYLLGHSLGEYVAACLAEVFDLATGLKLIVKRAELMQHLPGQGKMLACLARIDRLTPLLNDFPELSIAAYNASQSQVISGPSARLEQFQQVCEQQGIAGIELVVSHAFHSVCVEPIMAEFNRFLESLELKPAKLKLISNLTGRIESQCFSDPGYWVQHLRQAVRFQQGLECLREERVDTLIEIGPKAVLSGLAELVLKHGEPGQSHSDSSPAKVTIVASCQPNQAKSSLNQAMLELAQQGMAFNWSVLSGGQRVDLPHYPWQRKTFWPDWFDQHGFDSSKNGSSPNSADEHLSRNHQYNHQHKYGKSNIWAGTAIQSVLFPDTHLVFQQYLHLDHDQWLKQHQVFGLNVVPLAFFISMSYEALKVSGLATAAGVSQAIPRLNDIRVSQALVVPEQQTVCLQLIIDTQNHHCRIVSRFMDGADGPIDGPTVEWREHFSAYYEVKSGASMESRLEAPESFADEAGFANALKVSRESYYQLFHQQGIDYGESFKIIAQIQRLENPSFKAELEQPLSKLGIAKVPLSADAVQALQQGSPQVPHPILVDSLLQAIGTVLTSTDVLTGSTQDKAVPTELKLPTRIESLQIDAAFWDSVAENASYELWISATRDEQVNIALVVDHQRLVLQCEGVATYGIDEERLRQLLKPADNTAQWLYQPFWQEWDASPDEQVRNWLWIDPHNRCSELIQQLRQLGHHVERLELSSDNPLVNFNAIPGFERIDELVDARALTEMSSVKEISNTESEFSEFMQPVNQLLSQVQQLHEYFLGQAANPQFRLTVLSNEGIPQGGLSGLMSVVNQEYPQWRPRLIDVGFHPDDLNDSQLLLRALTDQSDEQLLKCDHLRLLQQRLKPYRLAKTDGNDGQFDSSLSYLISGGLGALGCQCAQWLVTKGVKKLILTTRHSDYQLPAELVELQTADSQLQIIVESLDITDYQALETLFEKARNGGLSELGQGQKPGKIGGIFHCAGFSDDDLIPHQSAERFNQTAAPKLAAALHLDRLSRYPEMRFFILFSSLNALLGSLGQSSYASANAAMDKVVEQRQQAGYSGLSVNWGPWQTGIKTDSSSDQDFRQFWQQLGIHAIEADAGMGLLGQLLNDAELQREVSNIAVFDVDWQRMAAHLRDERAPALIRLQLQQAYQNELSKTAEAGLTETGQPEAGESSQLAQIRAADPEQATELIQAYFIRRLAHTLRLSEQQIDLAANLSALGLDSLAAVELRSVMRKELQCDIAVANLIQGDVSSIIQQLRYQLMDAQAGGDGDQGALLDLEQGHEIDNEDDFVVGEL